MSFPPVAAFWIAYVVTRPLGASLGDYLAQDPDKGGLGLGSTLTTGLFLASIALRSWLSALVFAVVAAAMLAFAYVQGATAEPPAT